MSIINIVNNKKNLDSTYIVSTLLDFASHLLEKFGSKFFTRGLAQPRCSQVTEEERGCHTANNGCVKTHDIRNHLSAALSSGWCRNYQTEVSVTSIPFPSVSDFLLTFVDNKQLNTSKLCVEILAI
ncbi:hypothetical protein WN51_07597 [Melipona quadrifasciata]|uniref:Uncharacterized protein n=1 Tax=Melipona quadrifasciata TaxID=166423 RepID=A0A0M8ZNM8_9HYME|nr:hypothetical protein WN51_07597 [Melipona quadrifasciata]